MTYLGYCIAALALLSLGAGMFRLLAVHRSFLRYLEREHPEFLQEGTAVSARLYPLKKGTITWLLFQTNDDLGDPQVAQTRARIKALLFWNVASMVGTAIILLIVSQFCRSPSP